MGRQRPCTKLKHPSRVKVSADKGFTARSFAAPDLGRWAFKTPIDSLENVTDGNKPW